MIEQKRYAGRGVVVTGASGGIGRAVARRLAEEGASVWATDISAPPTDLGIRNRSLDVTQRDAWEALVQEIDTVEPIDAIFLCHGVSQPQVGFLDVLTDQWDRVMDINLKSYVHGLQSVLPGMMARGYGRVVATASIAAKEASHREHVYAASKAGLVALINSVAREIAQSGVTMNTVAPGPVETELWARLDQAVRDDRIRRTPMQRPATPDEVASLMLWLGSPEASYTTAQCYDISGGRATY